MKPKFNNYLKGIFVSSVAAIIPANAEADVYDLSKLNLNDNEFQLKENNHDLSPKLIIQFNDDESYDATSHRSHRSHSSHRSHYSSRSGTTTKKAKSNNNVILPSKPKTTTSTVKYTLGDRIIKDGMSGEDVTEMINLLVKKGYLELKDGQKTVEGIYKYEGVIVEAIKSFQKDNNLIPDGIITKNLVYLLKKE